LGVGRRQADHLALASKKEQPIGGEKLGRKKNSPYHSVQGLAIKDVGPEKKRKGSQNVMGG